MSDETLRALFALDEPPARDPAFVLETMRRIQRRRLASELASGVPWAVAASAILWLAAPWLEAFGRPAAAMMVSLGPAAAVGAAALFLAAPRLIRAA